MIFKVAGPPFANSFRNLSRIHPRAHFYGFLVIWGSPRLPFWSPWASFFDIKKRIEKGRASVRDGLRDAADRGGRSLLMKQLPTQGDAFQHQFTPTVPKGMVVVFLLISGIFG